jgi:hypothetical protein
VVCDDSLVIDLQSSEASHKPVIFLDRIVTLLRALPAFDIWGACRSGCICLELRNLFPGVGELRFQVLDTILKPLGVRERWIADAMVSRRVPLGDHEMTQRLRGHSQLIDAVIVTSNASGAVWFFPRTLNLNS